MELDVGGARRLVERRDQAQVVGLGQRHEALRAGRADQRIGAGEIDVVGDRGERRRNPFLVETARGVGQKKRLAAELAKGLDGDAHDARVAPLVIMAAALEQDDASALDRPDDETARVADDARLGKAGNVAVGDGGRLARLVGERTEPGTEDDAQGRQGVRARGPSAP